MGLPDSCRLASVAGKAASMTSIMFSPACKLSSIVRLATGRRLVMRLADTSKLPIAWLAASELKLSIWF